MRSKFTYREWHYTLPHEVLFHLSKDEYALYQLIIKGAP